MCTDTQYPSVVNEEPAFLGTVSVYSLVYPVYVRVRLNICIIRDQPPLGDDIHPSLDLSKLRAPKVLTVSAANSRVKYTIGH